MKVIYKTNRENYNNKNLKFNKKYEAYRRQKIRRMRYELNRKYLKIFSENRNYNRNKANEIKRKIGNKIHVLQVKNNSNEVLKNSF